jgi:hypothetical protein
VDQRLAALTENVAVAALALMGRSPFWSRGLSPSQARIMAPLRQRRKYDADMRPAWPAVLALLTLSCASDPLRARASVDLRCDEDQIQVKKLTEEAQDVSGCGQRAVYIKKCPSCDWTMGPPGSAP